MSGAGDDRRPPAVPSVRVAVLLVVICVVAAVALLVVAMRTSGPEQGAAPQVTCSPPPPPATEAHQLASAPDPAVAAGSRWRATLTTTCGVIGLELDGAAAPATVASFVTLARAGYWTDSV
ncbi:MAG TPA: hypothetical protein VFN43_04370, partial [Humibacillus sp.]|nr:hypothetical protein [Humibacillus sp.]